MAFNGDNMTPLGGNARAGENALDRNAPMGWAYQSKTDDLATVLATGYFDSFNIFLVAGQFIYVSLTDGKFFITILSVDKQLKQVTVDVEVFTPGDVTPQGLPEVLAIDNFTGGNDLEISNGDHIGFFGQNFEIKIQAPPLISEDYFLQWPPAQATEIGKSMAISDLSTGEFVFQFDLLARREQMTGTLSGAPMTITGGGTTIDIPANSGRISNFSNPVIPVSTPTSLAETLGYVPLAASGDGTYILGYNNNVGVQPFEILQSNLTQQNFSNSILMGGFTIIGPIVVALSPAPLSKAYGNIGSALTFIRLQGPGNISGNKTSANGANLSIDNEGGRIFVEAANFHNDPGDPDRPLLVLEPAISFFKVIRIGPMAVPVGGSGAFIDPDQFDNGSGALVPVPNNSWSVQIKYITPDKTFVVAYGQQTFLNQGAAEAAISDGTLLSTYVENPPLNDFVRKSFIVVAQGATDLSNPLQASFFEDSPFRGGGGTASTISGINAPGGIDTDIQFNDGGAFGGDSNLTWNKATNNIGLIGTLNGVDLFSDQAANTLFIGLDFPVPTVLGGGNLAIGSSALRTINNTSANSNTAVGHFAGQFVTEGADGAFFGASAGASVTTGGQNTFLGRQAAGLNANPLTGFGNVAVGWRSGHSLEGNSDRNTVLGRSAAPNLTDGDANVILGQSTALSLTDGSGNIIIGSDRDVPTASITGYMNLGGIMFADLTSQFAQIGGPNIKPLGPHTFDIIGSLNVRADTSGDGASVIFINSTPPSNFQDGMIAIGPGALSSVNDVTFGSSIAIGRAALENMVSGIGRNTAIGDSAGVASVTTESSIFLGTLAGANVPVGNHNIYIGSSARAPISSTTNFMNIGHAIFAHVPTLDDGGGRARIGGFVDDALIDNVKLEVSGSDDGTVLKVSELTDAQVLALKNDNPGELGGAFWLNTDANRFEGIRTGGIFVHFSVNTFVPS